jgi:hypothetical protein
MLRWPSFCDQGSRLVSSPVIDRWLQRSQKQQKRIREKKKQEMLKMREELQACRPIASSR